MAAAGSRPAPPLLLVEDGAGLAGRVREAETAGRVAIVRAARAPRMLRGDAAPHPGDEESGHVHLHGLPLCHRVGRYRPELRPGRLRLPSLLPPRDAHDSGHAADPPASDQRGAGRGRLSIALLFTVVSLPIFSLIGANTVTDSGPAAVSIAALRS